jgi:predicted nucleic acid-binding protein
MTKFVDTNILVYSASDQDMHKKNVAKGITSDLLLGKHVTSVQVLGEFSRELIEKFSASPSDIKTILSAIEDPLTYNKETILRALEIRQHQLHFWDAVIAATMLENDIHEIYTEDLTFNTIPGITVINPFA